MSAPIVMPLMWDSAYRVAVAVRESCLFLTDDGRDHAFAAAIITTDVASRTQAIADLRAQIPQLCISCDDSRAMHEATGDESAGRCLVPGCPCTCSPDAPEYFDVPAKEEA